MNRRTAKVQTIFASVRARTSEYEILLHRFIQRGHENFDYFLEHRGARMAALAAFLEKFDVKLGLDDRGLAAVSAWCPGHFGSLVADMTDQKTHQAFFQPLQPWTGQWRGLNVIFDLGIFLGESLIARSPRLHWGYQPGQSKRGECVHSGYGIVGYREARNHLDPMGFIYGECCNDEIALRAGRISSVVTSEMLVGKVRDFATR